MASSTGSSQRRNKIATRHMKRGIEMEGVRKEDKEDEQILSRAVLLFYGGGRISIYNTCNLI